MVRWERLAKRIVIVRGILAKLNTKLMGSETGKKGVRAGLLGGRRIGAGVDDLVALALGWVDCAL